MYKICFISQFPPPIHGLSKAVDTLYNSKLNQKYKFEKIDIKDNKRFLVSLRKIIKSDADLFYFTISQSRGGNIRDLIILYILRINKKKCLVHLHGGYYRILVDNLNCFQKFVNYKEISKLEGAIVLGPSLKWIFEGLLPTRKIYTIPNCIDDDYLISDSDFTEKIEKIKKNRIHHVLYLSNFIETKGYRLTLKLALCERNRVENGGEPLFVFDFAGEFFDTIEKNYFENYIKKNKLEKYVTYHGIVSGQKKKNLLKLCDIFTLLTRYPKEGQPISILEAMGNGMEIITTDHAGIPDIVDSECGMVVQNENNIDRIYAQMLNDCGKICNICIHNRNIVKYNYNQKIYIQNIDNCWEKILGECS